MIDTEKYQPARQNMKFVTRSLRSLDNKLHILANEELEIAPPKMKVKGYMYPQMKKPMGMLMCEHAYPTY
jgi:hypothetical protein